MAPRLLAAPIAASPATPAPAISTLAGGTLPAAVTWPVKKRPNTWAASITARYPAMLAMELSTSRDCAREMRGTASIARTVIGRAESASTRSGLKAGASRETRVSPSWVCSISAASGAFTFNTTSAAQTWSGPPRLAPAAA